MTSNSLNGLLSTQADGQLLDSQSLPAEIQEQVVEILDEYLEAVERGQPVNVDQLVARYPQFGELLREYLEGLSLLHGVDALGKSARDDVAVAVDEPRRRLGDYEVVREVGRGGMGVVYEAEQISLRRKVALKVLPFAAVLDQRQILRFENEARAAAQLHHPNIVPVYGVGSDRGVHFYAMQFIEGRSLRDAIEEVRQRRQVDAVTPSDQDNHAAENIDSIGAFSTAAPSDLRRRHAMSLARLGLEAAEALHAAHECGVVHRDIKPSNLMLDRRGKLWVTDFGLARCQANGSITKSGDVLGTLQYMSPEQAQGQTALIDQRTDVYSLGVTLYELLTLHRPFDGDSHANVVRQIELGQYQPVRGVCPSVPRDLENVIAKAMATVREDRYPSAQEMADDLRRFIDGDPIHAKPPSLVQRASKWVGRHRTAALAACLVLLLGVICLSVTNVVLSRGQAKTAQRLEENRQAFEEFGMRTAEWLKGTSGTENVRRALLTEVLHSHRQLLEQVGDSPAMRADTALTMSKVAAIHKELGDATKAFETYREAEEIWRRLVQDKPNETEHCSNLARCQNEVGLILRDLGDTSAAERSICEAIGMQKNLCRMQPDNFKFAADLATSWCNLGLIAFDMNNRRRAEAHFKRACNSLELFSAPDCDQLEIVDALAAAYGNLAMLHSDSDTDLAIVWSEKALEQRRIVVSGKPKDTSAKRLLASACSDVATLYARAGRLDEALVVFADAASIQRQLVQVDRGVVGHRRNLAVTLNNFGKAYLQADQLEEACVPLEESLTIQSALCSEFPGDVSMLSRLGGIHNNLAMIYQKQDRFPLAENHFRTGLACQQKALDLAPHVRDYREYFSRNLFNYGRLLRQIGKPFQAAVVTQKRAALWPNDAAQLYSSAKELTLAVRQMPRNDRRRKEWVAKAAATLRKASRVGWRPASDGELQAFAEVLGDDVILGASHPAVGGQS